MLFESWGGCDLLFSGLLMLAAVLVRMPPGHCPKEVFQGEEAPGPHPGPGEEIVSEHLAWERIHPADFVR